MRILIHSEKLDRLRQMPVREIAYRSGEWLDRETERWRLRMHKRNRTVHPASQWMANWGDPFSAKEYLRLRAAPRFYFDAAGAQRDTLLQFIALNYPQWIDAAVGEAEQVCRHSVPLLGYGEIALGAEIDWHRDPLTGQSWPRRFWADFDVVRDCGPGDPKCVHELNRHQHLTRLSKGYFLSGQERYAREAVAQLESWIEQNPEGQGINWQSSLELALRAISWMWTIFFLLPSEEFTEPAAGRILDSLFAQLEHVFRYPSRYSSPNTHLIGEATALFVGGTLFPEVKQGQAWRRLGESLLIQEMDRQITPEGVHAELSSCYHCYTVDFYLQALCLAKRNRINFPDCTWTKLLRALDFLVHLTRSGGSIPLLGDDDGGRALALGGQDYRSFPDALSTGAVLFRREAFKQRAGVFAEETLWLLGPDARAAYDSLPDVAPSPASAGYLDSGYFIQRTLHNDVESHLVFDCGGLGMSRGGHGHADALSLVLSVNGEELLIDPGTFVYNRAPEWRNFFRTSQAHNTVVVDGQEQADPAGTFSWKNKLSPRLTQRLALPELELLEAECAGNIVHRRRLLQVGSGYWVVADDFQGSGEHAFDFYYHFAPQVRLSYHHRRNPAELDVSADGRQAGLRMRFLSSKSFEAHVLRGKTDPIQGWASRRYGHREPAPVLQARLQSATPAGALSILLPTTGTFRGWSTSVCKADAGLAVACVLRNGDVGDFIVLPLSDSVVRIGRYWMRGEFFWLRTEGGELRELLAIRARTFREDCRVVLQTDEPRAHVWLKDIHNSGDAKICAESAA